jgi:hypothetical protein
VFPESSEQNQEEREDEQQSGRYETSRIERSSLMSTIRKPHGERRKNQKGDDDWGKLANQKADVLESFHFILVASQSWVAFVLKIAIPVVLSRFFSAAKSDLDHGLGHSDPGKRCFMATEVQGIARKCMLFN